MSPFQIKTGAKAPQTTPRWFSLGATSWVKSGWQQSDASWNIGPFATNILLIDFPAHQLEQLKPKMPEVVPVAGACGIPQTRPACRSAHGTSCRSGPPRKDRQGTAGRNACGGVECCYRAPCS